MTEERGTDKADGQEDRKEEKKGRGGWMPMLWGIVLFTGVGLATGNVGLWLPVGIAIGMAWQGFVRMGEENDEENGAEKQDSDGKETGKGEAEKNR